MNEEHRICSRREFVRNTGALMAGAGLSTAFSFSGPTFASGSPAPARIPLGTLGRTGVQISRMGIGCAPLSRKHVGVEDVRTVLYRALELGINYVDVAPNYGNEESGFSEEKMGPTIKEIRDRVFLVTKTEEATYEGTWRLLRQSMKRLHTDHFDMVHLHNFGHEERFPDLSVVLSKKGALGALLEARKQGVIRFIGASGHLYPSRFHAALETGEIDVLMNAVNFVTQHTYDFEHKVWSRARNENLGLVAMKVLGGRARNGNGFRLPKKFYQQAIGYALSVPGLSCAVIGVENKEQLEKAATTVAQLQPLSYEEGYELSKAGLKLAGTSPWKAVYGDPVT
ncbi:MAG: aldo/keto reductase [Acidobacteriota bacterium]